MRGDAGAAPHGRGGCQVPGGGRGGRGDAGAARSSTAGAFGASPGVRVRPMGARRCGRGPRAHAGTRGGASDCGAMPRKRRAHDAKMRNRAAQSQNCVMRRGRRRPRSVRGARDHDPTRGGRGVRECSAGARDERSARDARSRKGRGATRRRPRRGGHAVARAGLGSYECFTLNTRTVIVKKRTTQRKNDDANQPRRRFTRTNVSRETFHTERPPRHPGKRASHPQGVPQGVPPG